MRSFKIVALCLLIILVFQRFSAAQVEKKSESYIWDLSPLISNDANWDEQIDIIESKIIDINKYKGSLGNSAENLADAMDAVFDLRSRAGKLYMYGLLNYETNINSDQALLKYDVGSGFESRVESAVSFIKGEIKEIGRDKINKWLNSEPRLEKHRRRLNRILFEAPYTLNNESQRIIESMVRWPRLSVDAYDNFYSSNLGWPAVKTDSGAEIISDPNAYRSALRGVKNNSRDLVITSFLNKLETLQDAFGILFTRRVEADLRIAQNRGFKEGMEALWYLRDGMPLGSHKFAIEVSENNLNTLNRYLKLRAKFLGLKNMTFADVFTRINLRKEITIDETIQNYLNVSEIFGKNYKEKLKTRIDKPWMHLLPAENKSHTYGIFPPIDDSPPFVLMSYTGSLTSSRALAGALGLMMAFTDMYESHPSDTRDDPGITSNAIIYVSNLLYYDYLKKNSEDIKEKAAYVVEELELLVKRMFFYPMMAEFETRIENLILENDNPTGNTISEIYFETLKKYFGNDKNIMTIEKKYSYDWITHGILFLSYEDQFWYGAAAAAVELYNGLKNNNQMINKFFNEGYGIEESDRSYKMLLNAGINMNSKKPYKSLVTKIDNLCDELESLLNNIHKD